MLTADIDIGGTLTDGIFIHGEKLVCVKVDTTPHDLTVCLFDCLAQGATQLGYADVDAFLEHLELIRWSTTITSNVLAERSGPRIGLLVSRGHEKDLYGSAARSIVLDHILSEREVIGIEEATSDTEIMNSVRLLLEGGVRRICVSLKGAQSKPERETARSSTPTHTGRLPLRFSKRRMIFAKGTAISEHSWLATSTGAPLVLPRPRRSIPSNPVPSSAFTEAPISPKFTR